MTVIIILLMIYCCKFVIYKRIVIIEHTGEIIFKNLVKNNLFNK